MINHLHPSLRTVILRKRANHPTFGIYLAEDVPSGIYIVTIEPNSPAAEAQIQPGDRLLAVNGQAVSAMSSNPKHRIAKIAQTARSLTLMIQSMHLLDVIETFFPDEGYSTTYHPPSYPSQESIVFDHDLEK